MFLRNAVVAIMVLSLLACTTVQTVQVTATPETVAEQVKPEDRVIITAKNGRTYDLWVQEVAADSLTGKTEGGKRYKVMYGAMQSIRIERTEEQGAAAGIGVLGIVLIVVAVVAIAEGMEGFGDSVGEWFGDMFECMFGGCDDDDDSNSGN